MIFPMFAAIIFDALILCLALYLLAKHEAIVNTGIAALRREFQKPVARVERRQPGREAAAERERQAIEAPTRAVQPAKTPVPETKAVSPRDALLAAARERLAHRLPLSGPLDAISKSLHSSPEVVLDSLSFRSVSTASGGEGSLAASVRIPLAGEQAVVQFMDRVKNEPAFQPPWRVQVKSFSADLSPGASKNARAAVIECVYRATGRPAAPSGAATAVYSDADVQWCRSSVLVPRAGEVRGHASRRTRCLTSRDRRLRTVVPARRRRNRTEQ